MKYSAMLKPHSQIRSVLLAAAVGLGAAHAHADIRSNGVDTHVTPSRALGRTHDCSGFYPEISRERYETGDVLIQYDVRTDGSVDNVSLVKSSGFNQLDRAAVLCASERWRNTPATRDGIPIESLHHKAIVRFVLTESERRGRRWDYGDVWSYVIVFLIGTVAGLLIASATAWRRRKRVAGRNVASVCPSCASPVPITKGIEGPNYCERCGEPLAQPLNEPQNAPSEITQFPESWRG
jgi:TonB family protein